MIPLCGYCLEPIEKGQRHNYYPNEGTLYHLPCDERRKAAMADDTTFKAKLYPGEPAFLLRASDPTAPAGLIDYARRCQRAGAGGKHVDAAFDLAMEMSAWQRDNPELTKAMPDG